MNNLMRVETGSHYSSYFREHVIMHSVLIGAFLQHTSVHHTKESYNDQVWRTQKYTDDDLSGLRG